MLTWISRASLELIGQAGLGCSLDTLENDNTSAYGGALKSLMRVALSCIVSAHTKY